MIDKKKQSDRLTIVADEAFVATAKDVLDKARRAGTDVVLWKDNEIVEVSPDEIEQNLNELSPN